MNKSKENDNRLKKAKSQFFLALFLSFTLGLAPFFPEPHLIGKWRWLLGGAEGMQPMDWFDLTLHSAPWILLIFGLLNWINLKNKLS